MGRVLISVLFLLSSKAFGAEEGECLSLVRQFVQKHEKDCSKFEKTWKLMCETASKDSNEDEESFAKRYILNWMYDRSSQIKECKLSAEEKIHACLIYLVFKNQTPDGHPRRGENGKEYEIPSLISDHLTIENFKKFLGD